MPALKFGVRLQATQRDEAFSAENFSACVRVCKSVVSCNMPAAVMHSS